MERAPRSAAGVSEAGPRIDDLQAKWTLGKSTLERGSCLLVSLDWSLLVDCLLGKLGKPGEGDQQGQIESFRIAQCICLKLLKRNCAQRALSKV